MVQVNQEEVDGQRAPHNHSGTNYPPSPQIPETMAQIPSSSSSAYQPTADTQAAHLRRRQHRALQQLINALELILQILQNNPRLMLGFFEQRLLRLLRMLHEVQRKLHELQQQQPQPQQQPP